MSHPANFAPYQPPPPDPRPLPSPSSPLPSSSRPKTTIPSYQQSTPSRSPTYPHQGHGGGGSSSSSGGGGGGAGSSYAPVGSGIGGGGGAEERVNKYETSLGARVDIEAAGAYVLGVISGMFAISGGRRARSERAIKRNEGGCLRRAASEALVPLLR
ncbi:uncharacterized protein EV422DRAFT_325201 [Fimicolochytrium jonesii]|uniref:uncharacterized protein n=1 Tax=Fimicolochytrium jonesii TaxID=1396493 RepID=UPI0022FE89DF|nr:uncharacterized protein EV422DRAFT_325201 [Fimicolochytrium jonesii]KAI8824558.1 hypothetical protein EV422DRAFT_325201 [Fimicolochytrium jonesii]